MSDYNFVLSFRLPEPDDDPESFLDALFEAGCDDALPGIGRKGVIGLDFTREAPDAERALQTAIDDVVRAIPGASLFAAGPDIVGLTEMADIFGFSRQNMRKYAVGEIASVTAAFPEPIFGGKPSLWHLAEIAGWLERNTGIHPPAKVVDVAKEAAKVNLRLHEERVRRILEKA